MIQVSGVYAVDAVDAVDVAKDVDTDNDSHYSRRDEIDSVAAEVTNP